MSLLDFRASPIHTLPTEILIKVFFWRIVDDFERYRRAALGDHWGARRCGSYPRAWFTIRHVCKLWRQISLETTLLASRIVVNGTQRRAECVREMLERSGSSCRLEVVGNCFGGTSQDTAVYDLVLAQFHRVSRATLIPNADTFLLLCNYRPFAATSVSVLNSISVNLDGVPHTHFSPQSSQPTIFLPCIKFPSLEECKFRGGGFKLYEHMLGSSLRCLVLERLGLWIGVEELATCLNNTPALEELTVDACLGEDSIVLGDQGQRKPNFGTSLPNLRCVVIREEEGHRVMHLLHYLLYPTTATVRLQFVDGTDPSFGRSLAAKIRAYSTQMNTVQWASIHLKGHVGRYSEAMLLRFWAMGPDLHQDTTLSWASQVNRRLLLEFEILGTPTEADYVSQAFDAAKPISHITQLLLDGLSHYTLPLLRRLSSLLPDVRELIVTQLELHELLEELYPPATSLFSQKVTFPELEILHLDLSWIGSGGTHSYLEKVAAILSQRQLEPLEELRATLPDDAMAKEAFARFTSSESGLAKSFRVCDFSQRLESLGPDPC